MVNASNLKITQTQFDGGHIDIDGDLLDEIHVQIEEWVARGHPLSALPDWAPMVGPVSDYVGEIYNGGHSQYFANRANRADIELPNVVALFTLSGATAFADIARDALQWFKANPAEAQQQTGFTGGRAPALRYLDQRFAKDATHGHPTAIAAAWIRRQQGFIVVSDPPRASRPLMQTTVPDVPATELSLSRAREFLDDPASIGLALFAARTGSDVKLTKVDKTDSGQSGAGIKAKFSERGGHLGWSAIADLDHNWLSISEKSYRGTRDYKIARSEIEEVRSATKIMLLAEMIALHAGRFGGLSPHYNTRISYRRDAQSSICELDYCYEGYRIVLSAGHATLESSSKLIGAKLTREELENHARAAGFV